MVTPDNLGFRSTLDSALNQASGQGSNSSSSSFTVTQPQPQTQAQPQAQVHSDRAAAQGNSAKVDVADSRSAAQQKAPAKTAVQVTRTLKTTGSQNMTDASTRQTKPPGTDSANIVIAVQTPAVENSPVPADAATNAGNAEAGNQVTSAAPDAAATLGQASALNNGQGASVETQPEGVQLPATASQNPISPDNASASEAEAMTPSVPANSTPAAIAVELPNQPLPVAATAVPASGTQHAAADLTGNSTAVSQPVSNLADPRDVRELSASGNQKADNAKGQVTAAAKANAAGPAKGTIPAIGSGPVDSIQVTTSPKAAAVKTHGDHAGVASTTVNQQLQAAKAPASYVAVPAGNNAATMPTGTSPAATAPAGATAVAAGNNTLSSTGNLPAATASADSNASSAGSSASSSTGTSPVTVASADGTAANAGNNSQSFSDAGHNGGSPSDSQAAALASIANLAGSVVVAHPGALAGQAGMDGPDRTASAATAASPASADRSETTEASASPTLISPRVLESVQQTEMRVGVHPDGLGPIEIRAVMHGDQLGASISAQQADTRQWLVSHVNELTQTLNAHDLRVSSLSISDSPAGNSAQSGFGHSDSQGQGYQRNQPVLPTEASEPESNTEMESNPIGETYTRAGVDLRA